MVGKRFLVPVICAFLTFFHAPAMAALSAPFGYYLEGNIGSSKVSGVSYGTASTSSSKLAASLALGYKFMPYFGLELGAAYYSLLNIKYAGARVAQAQPYSANLAGKFIFPLNTSGFEAIAKIGIVRLVSKITIKDQANAAMLGISSGNQTSTSLYLGLGGQYYYTPFVAVVGQWARANGNSNTGTVDLYTIGVSYLFPGP